MCSLYGVICRVVSNAVTLFPNTPFHVAFMLHGGFVRGWKPLEMLVSMSHNLVQHEASISY